MLAGGRSLTFREGETQDIESVRDCGGLGRVWEGDGAQQSFSVVKLFCVVMPSRSCEKVQCQDGIYEFVMCHR